MNSSYGLARRMTSAEAALMAIEVETIMTSLGWPLSDLEAGEILAFPRQALEACPRCGCWHLAVDGFAYCDET